MIQRSYQLQRPRIPAIEATLTNTQTPHPKEETHKTIKDCSKISSDDEILLIFKILTKSDQTRKSFKRLEQSQTKTARWSTSNSHYRHRHASVTAYNTITRTMPSVTYLTDLKFAITAFVAAVITSYSKKLITSLIVA